MGFSNWGNFYLTSYIQLRKQKRILITTKSLKQYRNIKAQTSDEIQTVEIFEWSTVVFDDIMLSKKPALLICFFLQEGDTLILIYATFLKAI